MLSIFNIWPEKIQHEAWSLRCGVEFEFEAVFRDGETNLPRVAQEIGVALGWPVEKESAHQYELIHKGERYPLKEEITDNCFEMVTPPLGGKDRFLPVERFVQTLKCVPGLEVSVDNRCGIHVHVDATGHSVDRIFSVWANFVQHQAVLYDLVGSSEDRLCFCKPIPVDAIFTLANSCPQTVDELKAAIARHPLFEDSINDGRNYGLNMHALGKHGTYEFRLFDATLDSGKISLFAELAVALVVKSEVAPGPMMASLRHMRQKLCPPRDKLLAQFDLVEFLDTSDAWRRQIFCVQDKITQVAGNGLNEKKRAKLSYNEIGERIRPNAL